MFQLSISIFTQRCRTSQNVCSGRGPGPSPKPEMDTTPRDQVFGLQSNQYVGTHVHWASIGLEIENNRERECAPIVIS